MIEKLHLKNFTAFQNVEIELSPKINVIIGENGTGKTHLLKAAYSLCSAPVHLNETPDATDRVIGAGVTAKFQDVFGLDEGKVGSLYRQGIPENAAIKADFTFGKKIYLSFSSRSGSLQINSQQDYARYSWRPVFIPTKEILNLVGAIADPKVDRELLTCLFDATHMDLAEFLGKDGEKNLETVLEDPKYYSSITKIAKLLGGRYEWGRHICEFRSGKYRERKSEARTNQKSAKMYQDSTDTIFQPSRNPLLSSRLTAEGFKKMGILDRLLCNETIKPGVSGPLFWDEPEANLNPQLMKVLVEVLLEMARNGQQIVLATHDYVLLKWFDLLCDTDRGDHVRFHLLSRESVDKSVMVNTCDEFSLVSKSSISDTFAELYDEEVERAFR